MIIEKDVEIPANDGAMLRANVYRPTEHGERPVIMAMGIYGKDVHFADGYQAQWDVLLRIYPDVCRNGSSGEHIRWELADPERWVPNGYVVISVDSRGSGKSPGYLDPFSPRETQDLYDAIEWAARQPWSNGKVGLLGISYYAIKQWQVASLQPPHLAAICPWEGCCDLYRDWSRHGGIFSNLFPTAWWPRQVLVNQHGNGDSPYRDRQTGERTTGPSPSAEMLSGNRANHPNELLAHPLDDEWYAQRSPDLNRVLVPLLSAGNWGGPGLHLRGNIEGFMRAGSGEKWLAMHIGAHFESFYIPEYIELQRKFFDYFLKGVDNGWRSEPKVRLAVRRPDGAATRMEQDWPLARTKWTKFYLRLNDHCLATVRPSSEASVSYQAMGEGASFISPPFEQEMEFTGPLMARLWVSSTTADLDMFATLRMLDPEGHEVIFPGASEPTPVTRGWLRASHRKLDPALSLFYRPYHSHDERQKLEPGELYSLDVEIWPTSIVYPKNYRMVLTLQGRDFEFPGVAGRMLHNHEADRAAREFGGVNSVYSGPWHESFLLLPLIP